MFRPFPIVGGSYTDDALPWAHQDTVNYLPVRAEREGTRSPAKLAMVPGMRVFADVGTGPHRGARDVEGQRFVVSGTKLYRVALDGVATELGTIPGTGRVCMTHNQIVGGHQVVIGTRSSGYVYNTYTGTFAQITDDAFPGLRSVDFLNQHTLGVEPFGRYWFHSALVDATDYNALDAYQAETSPDKIMGLIALRNEVFVFGSRSIEPWTNVPSENAAFQLQRGSVIESGCASGDTICKLDNSVFYLTENGQVARLNGYTPQIVSTYAMEGAIKDCDLSRAFAFTWEDKGHTVYYLTFPDGHTWGYDVRQNEWHRRKSYGADRWRLNTLFKSAGHWYGGDYKTGKLFRLDWDYALDGCDPIERIRTCGYVHGSGEKVTVNAFQVRMDTGADESVPHDGVTISGEMPDAYVGDAVDFTYTVTTAYPGQGYELEVSGLPDGLSMSATGQVTGTVAESGTFNITISSVDGCGTESSHSDSVTIGPMTISGDVPDGSADDVVSGAYTNTHGVEPITYAVTSGTFPDGLTLATDGTYSGTLGEGGSYAWTVTGTDSEGNTATVDDTAVVAGYTWVMARSSSEAMYLADDPVNGPWTTTTRNNGPTYSGEYRVIATGVERMFVHGGTSASRGYYGADFDPSGGLGTSVVTLGYYPVAASVFDGGIVCLPYSNSNGYSLSTNYGASFSANGRPLSKTAVRGMGRLDSGRWLLSFGAGSSDCGVMWTDDEVPSDDANWTPVVFSGQVDSSGSPMACNGVAACVMIDNGRIYRTTDGQNYTLVYTSSAASPDRRAAFADGDLMLIGVGQAGGYLRSVDGGLNWSELSLPSSVAIEQFVRADGLVMAVCTSSNFYSTDDGETFSALTLPFTRGFNEGVGVSPVLVLP